MTEAEVGELQKFLAQESALFYSHVRAVAEKYNETGELPNSLFGKKAVQSLLKAGKRGGSKGGEKRKPSVFNLFVKEKLAGVNKDPKATGTPFKDRFKLAVSEWSALTDDQKKEFAAKCAHLLEDNAPTGLPDKVEAETKRKQEAVQEEEENEKFGTADKAHKKKKKQKVRAV